MRDNLFFYCCFCPCLCYSTFKLGVALAEWVDTGNTPFSKPKAIGRRIIVNTPFSKLKAIGRRIIVHRGSENFVPQKVTTAEPKPVPTITKPHVLPADVDDESIVAVENSPAHFLTKIESFSLFSDYGIDKYETREFEAGDYKWRLIIYPNGKEKGDFISVFLAMAETSYLPMNWEFNANFTIYIYNQISDKYLGFRLKRGRRFNEAKSEWGFPNFMSKNVLKNKSNGYLLDDNLVLGTEVYIFKRQQVVERVTLLQPSKYLGNWKVPELSKLKDVWTCEEFRTSGLNWKMELYPKGDFSSDDNAVKINLVCVSAETFATHKKVKAEFCMRLIGGSNAVIHDCEFSQWFTFVDTTGGFSFKSLAETNCSIQVEICVQVIV